MEIKRLPPHRAAAVKKAAEKKYEAHVIALTKDLPPHQAAAVRKKAERERAEQQEVVSEPLPAPQPKRVHMAGETKKKKTKIQKVIPDGSPPLTTLFSNAAWERAQMQEMIADGLRSPPHEVAVVQEARMAGGGIDGGNTETVDRMPVLAIHEDEIAEPEQTPELTAIAEIELDIKLARMKACAGASTGLIQLYESFSARGALRKMYGGGSVVGYQGYVVEGEEEEEEEEEEEVDERNAYQVAYGRCSK